ncbi:hypothetical protein F4819DRAFT_163384 [Hypoxylon fuscum]|nr:hypothetical protein F4819DRAFT_163384 [Hypoxylon fuscum]
MKESVPLCRFAVVLLCRYAVASRCPKKSRCTRSRIRGNVWGGECWGGECWGGECWGGIIGGLGGKFNYAYRQLSQDCLSPQLLVLRGVQKEKATTSMRGIIEDHSKPRSQHKVKSRSFHAK